jgi:hypothetical protein
MFIITCDECGLDYEVHDEDEVLAGCPECYPENH